MQVPAPPPIATHPQQQADSLPQARRNGKSSMGAPPQNREGFVITAASGQRAAG